MPKAHKIAIEKLPDEELVALAQAGDGAAFGVLAERHRKLAMRTAYAILNSNEDAEDEVQNALWKAYQNLEGFEGGCKFSTWLTRIVVNQCLMRVRSRRRAQFVPIDEPLRAEEGSASPRELPDERHMPDRELAQRQVHAVVQREVRRIPPLLRDALVLKHLHDLGVAEVAERLGITAAATKSRLIRARSELESRLRKHQGRMGPATLVA